MWTEYNLDTLRLRVTCAECYELGFRRPNNECQTCGARRVRYAQGERWCPQCGIHNYKAPRTSDAS